MVEYDDDAAKPPEPKQYPAKPSRPSPSTERDSARALFESLMHDPAISLGAVNLIEGDARAKVSPDGSFNLENVQPNQYKVSVSWSPASSSRSWLWARD